MNVILYKRVSQEEQAEGDSVSLEQQSKDMYSLCERQGWSIVDELENSSNYRATKYPHKGMIVNPSGERDDRPQFLTMLESVKTGDIDAVVCWRDDRLVRHPRVAVALEDALDIGDTLRNGRGKIQLYDASGAVIDRFILQIKATIGRDENKRRAERTYIGKRGTLESGRWPGRYDRLGYMAVKEESKRGRTIILVEEEAATVRRIYDLYKSGVSIAKIRKILTLEGALQRNRTCRKRDWGINVITAILHSEDYTGTATWMFSNGNHMSIPIPAIISVEQYKHVQAIMKDGIKLSTRNSKGIYLLQGVGYCGECKSKLVVHRMHYYYRRLKDGTVRRYVNKTFEFDYHCWKGISPEYRDEHPQPKSWYGTAIDWAVWRKIVDDGIKRPEYIIDQIASKVAELQSQGDSVDGDIAKARQKIADIEEERATYQRQLGRKKITEKEFDARMEETEESLEYWQAELSEYMTLRDEADKVQIALNYITELMGAIQEKLPAIDIPPEELGRLPEDEQMQILKARQEIIRALVNKVYLFANGAILIDGVIEGIEALLFTPRIPETCGVV